MPGRSNSNLNLNLTMCQLKGGLTLCTSGTFSFLNSLANRKSRPQTGVWKSFANFILLQLLRLLPLVVGQLKGYDLPSHTPEYPSSRALAFPVSCGTILVGFLFPISRFLAPSLLEIELYTFYQKQGDQLCDLTESLLPVGREWARSEFNIGNKLFFWGGEEIDFIFFGHAWCYSSLTEWGIFLSQKQPVHKKELKTRFIHNSYFRGYFSAFCEIGYIKETK